MPVTRLRRPPQGYRKLRPHPWLFRQGLVATLAFLVPTFGVLYFLTVPDGPWPAVIVTQVVASIAVVLACRSYFRVGVWIDPRGVAERGLLGRTTWMQTADIGSIVRVRTFEGGGAETVPQLFVCDHDGNQVIRLRGQFWSEDAMRIVCDQLDVTVTELNQSVTPRELLERYPGLLYWFERRPVLAAALFSAAILAVGSLLYLGLAAAGIT
ncbi:hypothetical protein [Conyzicola sp.]|uniref:hypothetical protein n=1 Tax=Conyzicola sp. TaxID=1969404 RepID=UPI003989F976